mgnify:CR=1 FL=1
MSFWGRFESKQPGIEDTIEFTIRLAVATLACVILVVVVAMVAGLFVSDSVVSNDKIFDPPAPEPVVSQPEETTPVVSQETAPVSDNDHDDDDMAPWERYRNDLRYDANGDGVVDENDFPDWRNPNQ